MVLAKKGCVSFPIPTHKPSCATTRRNMQYCSNKCCHINSYPGVEVALLLVTPNHTPSDVAHAGLCLSAENIPRVTASQLELF